jgi:hypothetical protein
MSHSLFQKTGIKTGLWNSSHGPTRIIDFNLLEVLRDEYAAYGCIVVSTSNGKIGTLTHLDILDIENIDFFVTLLSDELKDNIQSSHVILSGGSNQDQSIELSNKIKMILETNGYTVIATCLDHQSDKVLRKITTITKDKILINEYEERDEFPAKKQANNQEKITEVKFSDGEINTYYSAIDSSLSSKKDGFKF